MTNQQFHVELVGGRYWSVRKHGAHLISKRLDGCLAAVQWARRRTKPGDQVVLHNPDGTVKVVWTNEGARPFCP